MRTLYDMAKEARKGMVQTLISEGGTDNPDYAAAVLLRAGYRPGTIYLLLDEVMAEAREASMPRPAPSYGPNVLFIHGARP